MERDTDELRKIMPESGREIISLPSQDLSQFASSPAVFSLNHWSCEEKVFREEKCELSGTGGELSFQSRSRIQEQMG